MFPQLHPTLSSEMAGKKPSGERRNEMKIHKESLDESFPIVNRILERETIVSEIKHILSSFDKQQHNVTFKKGIYIYGSPGSGKTEFVMNILREMDYDIIKYDAGDVRNKALIESITSNNISSCNVLQMMKKQTKKIAIVMDEIDGMNNGDKGGLTSLIKLIRQKKTKKQKLEDKTMNPIVCIGNYYIDKKIKELMKVCTPFELKTPQKQQIRSIMDFYIRLPYPEPMIAGLLDYIQGDMRKMDFVIQLCKKRPDMINEATMGTIFQQKSYNEDSKKITNWLLHNHAPIETHNTVINETDRTIVALLWHENIVDMLPAADKPKSIPLYLKMLDTICFADYIDRITFQNQIWQFNEMSSLMKTFQNNKLFHDTIVGKNKKAIEEIRFTKVLTKYSTEYNNQLFVFNLCQELEMDKNDLIAFFQELRLFYGKENSQTPEVLNQMENIFEHVAISKLDIRRMYRYLDKNVKKEVVSTEESDDEEMGDE